jgi:TfoX/Sxy family transcriptional regulator of competence genes
MKFVAAPPELIALFNAVIPVDTSHRIEPKKTLGYPSCFIGGHMFMGLFADKMMLRLSPEDREELIGKGGAVFEPVPGKVQKDYVTVPASVLESQTALLDWVHRALVYTSSLPPREKGDTERPPDVGTDDE